MNFLDFTKFLFLIIGINSIGYAEKLIDELDLKDDGRIIENTISIQLPEAKYKVVQKIDGTKTYLNNVACSIN